MLSLRLKRRSGGALVGAALAVTLAALMLAVFPAVAEAQIEDKSTPTVVVQSGDSLWSISKEHLAPNASPQRIVMGAEQIHALNRGLIGADPNLIFVGQELFIPPVMSGRPTGATPTHKTTGATGATAKALRTAPGGADAKYGDVSAPVAERETQREADPVNLPVLPDAAAAPVPSVRMLASNDSPPSPLAPVLRSVSSAVASAASVVAALTDPFADARDDERRLLGLGVLLLTLVLAAFMAWKLPMRRTTREDAERWRIPAGYYYGAPAAHHNAVPFASYPGSPGDRDPEAARQAETPVALTPEQRDVPTSNGATPAPNSTRNAAATTSAIASGVTARRARKAKPKPKASPRNGLALGAHNPGVRSASLLARAPARARNPRLLRRAARPSLASAPEQKRSGEQR